VKIKKSDLQAKYENFTAMFDKEKDIMVVTALKRQLNSNPESTTVRTMKPTCVDLFGIKLANDEEWQCLSKLTSGYFKKTKHTDKWKEYHEKLPNIFIGQATKKEEKKEQTNYINDLLPTLTSDKRVKITVETVDEDFVMCKVINGDIGRDIACLLVKN